MTKINLLVSPCPNVVRPPRKKKTARRAKQAILFFPVPASPTSLLEINLIRPVLRRASCPCFFTDPANNCILFCTCILAQEGVICIPINQQQQFLQGVIMAAHLHPYYLHQQQTVMP